MAAKLRLISVSLRTQFSNKIDIEITGKEKAGDRGDS
jgi:hypothetical protein